MPRHTPRTGFPAAMAAPSTASSAASRVPLTREVAGCGSAPYRPGSMSPPPVSSSPSSRPTAAAAPGSGGSSTGIPPAAATCSA